MDTIRVVIADDDPDMAAALREVLTAHPAFEVRAVVGNGPDAAEEAARAEAHLVLMDVRMPGGGGSGVSAVRARSPRSAVVAISATADPATIADLLRAGAVGFVAKGWSVVELPVLLLAVADGAVAIAARSGAEALRLVAGRRD